MASSNNERPIIIVRRSRHEQQAHHGGAWKVAYADFVTAMMAFFLVMWLVTSVSKDQRAAIFDYFKNPSMEPGHSVKPAPGQTGPGGASTSPINLHGGLESPRVLLPRSALLTPVQSPSTAPTPSPASQPASAAANATPGKVVLVETPEASEHRRLESLMEDLHKAVEESQALRPFKDQLLLDITSEGLRIQIVDAQNRAMFDLGSSRLKDYTSAILHELAHYLNTVPNRISLSGHTDVKAFVGRGGYSNWELSADRANAARRALEEGGLASEKIARVVGLSSSVLFDRDHPEGAVNRRISIVVLSRTVDPAPGQDVAPAAPAAPAVPGKDAAPLSAAAASSAASP
jgi:chemotaxis protein MotB